MKVDLPVKFIIDNCIVELQSFAYNPEDKTLIYIDSYEHDDDTDSVRANVDIFKVDPEDKILDLFKYHSPFNLDMIYEAYHVVSASDEETAEKLSKILSILYEYRDTHTCVSTKADAWTLYNGDNKQETDAEVQHEVQ